MRGSRVRLYGSPWLVVAVAALVLTVPATLRTITFARAPESAPSLERPAPPELASVEGRAHVVDGDTLDLAGIRVRLEGIDAPEADQTCARAGGGTWPCGRLASSELQRLIGRATVRCHSRGTDTYGRMLGVCTARGAELNAEMVRRGYAWAFTKYSRRYVREEADAKAARAGIWQAPTTTAWDHRSGRWTTASRESRTPSNCLIKGNISGNGRIYHMPWSPWYDKISISPSRGERWFCTEAEALAAGWRPARVN